VPVLPHGLLHDQRAWGLKPPEDAAAQLGRRLESVG
jgi:hypothetical protein